MAFVCFGQKKGNLDFAIILPMLYEILTKK